MSSKRKKFFTGLALILFLPVLLILLAIQPFFINAVILPQVAKATDSQIEIGDFSLSPLKSLSLSDVRFTLNDKSLDAKISTVILRYDLMKIIKGNVWVDECSLISPDITYRVPQTPSSDPAADSEQQAASAAPPQLHIQNLTVSDGTLTLHQEGKVLQLKDLDIKLPELVNGKPLSPRISTKLLGFKNDTSTQALMEGQLESSATLQLSDRLLPTSFKGTLKATIGKNEAGIPPLVFELDADLGMDLENRIFTLHTLFAKALQDNKPLLTLQLNQPAEINLQEKPPQFTDTELTFVIPPLQLKTLPFAEFIPVSSGEISLNSRVNVSNSGNNLDGHVTFSLQNLHIPFAEQSEALRLGSAKGDGSFHWKPDADVVAKLHLSTSNLKLPDGRDLPSPLQIRIQGSGSPTRANVDQLEFAWAKTTGFQNRIQGNGFADWQNSQAIEADIHLQAQKLDLNPWSAFLVQQAPPNSVPPGSAVESTAKSQALQPPTLPLKSLKLVLNAEQVTFEQIRLDQVSVNLHADSGSIRLHPLSLGINGSTFLTKLDAQWKEPPLEVTLESSLSPLNLQPIIDSLMPDKKGAVTGRLQADTDVRMQGNTAQALWKSFEGNVEVSYTEGKLRLLNADPEQNTALLQTRKLVQDLVGALAKALQLSPEKLMSPAIESVMVKTQIADQHLSLEKARIINQEFLLDASGEVALLPDLGQSKFESLPVVVGLGTNVAKRVKVYRESRVQEDHVILPSFIEVGGTLAEPEIDVKESVITGLIISGVTERNELGNENVQAGLDILGSLLTGEPIPEKTPRPEPTPIPGVAPTPTPKPDTADRILQGMRLFQQLRATPTPSP